MEERREIQRHRALLGGKIVFNDRRSVIDCLIRNLSDTGVNLQVESSVGIPSQFGLVVDGEKTTRACKTVWSSENRIGAEFIATTAELDLAEDDAPALVPAVSSQAPSTEKSAAARPDVVRMQLLTLRAALDEVAVGVVLLDAETRAQFINRAFRRMFRVTQEKADSKPPFVALMYHGRDTRAYDIPEDQLDAYVAERVSLVRAGDPGPTDIRLANGEVLRMTCSILPAGGRMLTYTYVTDLVRYSDQLQVLHAALDDIPQGVLLLDSMLNVKFINRAARDLWAVSEQQLAGGLSYITLAANARGVGMFDVDEAHIGKFISDRIAAIRGGDPRPVDIPHRGGRILRATCHMLPGGEHMVLYSDVTDLVARADNLARLAGMDTMTGVYNRREFNHLMETEWSRFQRYHRPLALLLIDVDGFKGINDTHGHAVGDRAIMHLATLCNEGKRASDIVARIGGDEFAVLLPETDEAQARIVAERLREKVGRVPIDLPGSHGGITLSVSIGHAQASLSMSGVEPFLQSADAALYEAKEAGRNRVVSAARPEPADLRNAAE